MPWIVRLSLLTRMRLPVKCMSRSRLWLLMRRVLLVVRGGLSGRFSMKRCWRLVFCRAVTTDERCAVCGVVVEVRPRAVPASCEGWAVVRDAPALRGARSDRSGCAEGGGDSACD